MSESQIINEIYYAAQEYKQLEKTIAENEKDLQLCRELADRWVLETAEGAFNRDFILKNDPTNNNLSRIGVREWNLNQNKEKLAQCVEVILFRVGSLRYTHPPAH